MYSLICPVTSLLFPRGLPSNGRGVVTIEWEGESMRYQADRKFINLGSYTYIGAHGNQAGRCREISTTLCRSRPAQ